MGGGRIDFHVHTFPKDLETRISQFSAEFKEPFFERLMLPAKGKSLQGWVSEMEMLNHMDAAGIEKVVLQGWYWQNLINRKADYNGCNDKQEDFLEFG